MSLPDWLRAVLPDDTAVRWSQLAPVVPAGAYLVGGTGLTVHLQHRLSRDLDFFVTEPFDPEVLAATISTLSTFAVTQQEEGTLNGVLGSTKVQFLEALDQTFVDAALSIEGLQVAGIGDLLATKLKVVRDRGEHRDYFDLKVIEQRGGRSVEEGLALFARHYRLADPARATYEIVRGLGYHADLDEDPGVPEPLHETTAYWTSRVPQILAGLPRT